MLRADNLTFGYSPSHAVVNGLSAAVRPGVIAGLIGPNGSGKTTTLRLLAGTLRPRSGHVWLDDVEIGALGRRELARRVAMVPQDTSVAFDFTAMDIVLMGRHPYLGPLELEGPDDVDAATRAMRATNTEQFASRCFTTLSGGERQRVVIASALAQLDLSGPGGEGRVLLLDEPTSSLDLRHQLVLASLLERLNQSGRLTIVVSTHDLNWAASVCHELILIREGAVLAAGGTETVLTRESIRRLYDTDAAVSHHPEAGRLTVVPLPRGRGESPPP